MPNLRTVASRLAGSAILTIATFTIFSGVYGPQPADANSHCANGSQARTLEWSEDSNPANGAVWSGTSNTFNMGEGLVATATLSDNGLVDASSTLTNSGLLAAASPGQAGSLVWNLDTSSLAQPASSTLLFEFSQPVSEFEVVVLDVDAKSSAASNVGWHDQVSGFANGEPTIVSLLAANPAAVTVEGVTAWAADGAAKTANESPQGNLTVSATGTISSAGLTYSDGPRSGANPERHAIGVDSIKVCIAQPGATAETTTTAAETTTTQTPAAETTVAETTTPETIVTETTATETTAAETTVTERAATETTAGETKVAETAAAAANVEGTNSDDAVSTAEPTETSDAASESTGPSESSTTTGAGPPHAVPTETNSDLAVTTTSSKPTSNGVSSYSFTYAVKANNQSTSQIDSVQLFLDLESALSAADSWKIDSVKSADDHCTNSDTYNGTTNNALLATEVDLASGESCTTLVAVTVTPKAGSQTYTAAATASGFDAGSQMIEGSTKAATVAMASSDQALAFTGTEAEDIAAVGALLFLLGAVLFGYRERFLEVIG